MNIDKIKFTKMQGAGNDFVVLDNRQYQFRMKDLIQMAPKLCDRKFGIGADGLLVLSNPQIDGLDYTMIYRNADGSDAGMCGNGARCLALFASRSGFDTDQRFNVHDNIYRAKVRSNDEVEVSFPIKTQIQKINLDDQSLYQVYTGTEHVVKQEHKEDKLNNENDLRKEGRHFRLHDHFQPIGTNVNFIYGSGEKELRIQTYERGVEDLTLACGTGAIASALVWHNIQHQNREAKSEYTVKAKGGKLSVEFAYNPTTNTYSDIKLKGKVHFVFTGEYYL
ncbi:diaminopimelate epimerase [Aliifodinibius sp. S!AR15-10]|uniref:diaminopimelate epimerase n=1 Tax=Aliifodinibius sp. S!AR15-10 TaxID=2950437 RepID=UPI00285A8BAB|nr:diaminopimelate epimerase [Aliifodinibius sp. S!AR15-10]MDR8390397.1 diaminopimelate epimerase [Aliifodinibius sp. S!AR15-10]